MAQTNNFQQKRLILIVIGLNIVAAIVSSMLYIDTRSVILSILHIIIAALLYLNLKFSEIVDVQKDIIEKLRSLNYDKSTE